MQEACEHEGLLVSEFLGNITRVQHVREFLRGLQGDPGPKFPVLLKKVVYDGTHTGDWIPVKQSPALLREVDACVGTSPSDILNPSGEQGILRDRMKHGLCEASYRRAQAGSEITCWDRLIHLIRLNPRQRILRLP